MRRLGSWFLFVLFLVCVNSFDFRCNLPDEDLRRGARGDAQETGTAVPLEPLCIPVGMAHAEQEPQELLKGVLQDLIL